MLGADLIIFCAQFTKLAVLVFGALFLQDRLGLSALEAGAALLVALIPVMLTAVLSGRLTDRHGSRVPTLVGVAGTGIALAWLSFTFQALLLGAAWLRVATGAVSRVARCRSKVSTNRALSGGCATRSPSTRRGQAAGVATTGRQLGGVLAVAVLGGILIGTDDYALVFGLAAAVTFAVGVAAYLLIDRPWAPGTAAPVPADSRSR